MAFYKKIGVSSRRELFDLSLRACAISGLAGFLPLELAAQTSNRALVCVYLHGGNDSNNLVVPMNQYSSYYGSRAGLAIAASDLLPSRAVDGAVVGFHPATAGLRDLFDLGALGIVANVGIPGSLPGDADPHVAYVPGGFLTSSWGAKVSGGFTGYLANSAITGFASAAGGQLGRSNGLTFLGTDSGAHRLAVLAAANSKSNIVTPFPATPIGQQLRQVASVLKSGQTEGLRNRMFFAVQGGYDTHQDQLSRQADLLGQLSAAMSAFYAATVEIGMAHKVTTFTDSPFGRTLKSNAAGGSEHGWGSNHIVMGGAVLGRQVYGQFPDLKLGGAQDATGSGVWVPSITRNSYAATLALWNGASGRATSLALPGADMSGIENLQFLA